MLVNVSPPDKHGFCSLGVTVDIVIAGIEKGKKVIKLREGDVIKCDKNIEHWHSSTKQKLVSYLAVYGASNTIWTEKLEKEYYDNIKIEPDVIKY